MELEGRHIRLAIVGGPCVGKSCISKRFVENSFHGNPYNPTLGVDFCSRRLTIPLRGTGTIVIIDIGGQAIESKMLGIYFNAGVDILLLCYDVTNMSSLNLLRSWIAGIQRIGVDISKLVVGLVGSKADLEHLRTVRLDNHTRFKQEYDIPLSFIVSAKSGENVQTCFTTSCLAFINPDGRNRTRDQHSFGLGQSLLIPKGKGSPTASHVPAGPVPIPAPAIKRQGTQENAPPTTSTAETPGKSGTDSAVCSIQ